MRYHLDRCAFCAQCVQTCRFGCLQMGRDGDGGVGLAAAIRAPFAIAYGEEGNRSPPAPEEAHRDGG